MLKIDRDNQSFSLLDTPTLADVSITERYDLQEFICNTPDAFFKEIGQELFLLGKEIECHWALQNRPDMGASNKATLTENSSFGLLVLSFGCRPGGRFGLF